MISIEGIILTGSRCGVYAVQLIHLNPVVNEDKLNA